MKERRLSTMAMRASLGTAPVFARERGQTLGKGNDVRLPPQRPKAPEVLPSTEISDVKTPDDSSKSNEKEHQIKQKALESQLMQASEMVKAICTEVGSAIVAKPTSTQESHDIVSNISNLSLVTKILVAEHTYALQDRVEMERSLSTAKKQHAEQCQTFEDAIRRLIDERDQREMEARLAMHDLNDETGELRNVITSKDATIYELRVRLASLQREVGHREDLLLNAPRAGDEELRSSRKALRLKEIELNRQEIKWKRMEIEVKSLGYWKEKAAELERDIIAMKKEVEETRRQSRATLLKYQAVVAEGFTKGDGAPSHKAKTPTANNPPSPQAFPSGDMARSLQHRPLSAPNTTSQGAPRASVVLMVDPASSLHPTNQSSHPSAPSANQQGQHQADRQRRTAVFKSLHRGGEPEPSGAWGDPVGPPEGSGGVSVEQVVKLQSRHSVLTGRVTRLSRALARARSYPLLSTREDQGRTTGGGTHATKRESSPHRITDKNLKAEAEGGEVAHSSSGKGGHQQTGHHTHQHPRDDDEEELEQEALYRRRHNNADKDEGDVGQWLAGVDEAEDGRVRGLQGSNVAFTRSAPDLHVDDDKEDFSLDDTPSDRAAEVQTQERIRVRVAALGDGYRARMAMKKGARGGIRSRDD